MNYSNIRSDENDNGKDSSGNPAPIGLAEEPVGGKYSRGGGNFGNRLVGTFKKLGEMDSPPLIILFISSMVLTSVITIIALKNSPQQVQDIVPQFIPGSTKTQTIDGPTITSTSTVTSPITRYGQLRIATPPAKTIRVPVEKIVPTTVTQTSTKILMVTPSGMVTSGTGDNRSNGVVSSTILPTASDSSGNSIDTSTTSSSSSSLVGNGNSSGNSVNSSESTSPVNSSSLNAIDNLIRMGLFR